MMPIYVYSCDKCDEITEALQHLIEPPLTECEHCKKGMLTKVMGETSFRLKGTGWYETDYKHK